MLNKWVVINDPFLITVENMSERVQKAITAWNDLQVPRFMQKNCRACFLDLFGSLLEKPVCESLMATIVLAAVWGNSPEHTDYLYKHLHIYMDYGDFSIPELCREIVIRELKHTSRSDLSNSGKEFLEIIKESKNEHVMDILGFALDELLKKGELTDSMCEELTDSLKTPLLRWRNLDVPKTAKEESYQIMKELECVLFAHHAYETCLILSPMLMIAGTDCQSHYEESLFFVGKILYELGYLEYAKNCFLRVVVNGREEVLNASEDKKYKELLNADTYLMIPHWVEDQDLDIAQMLKNGQAFWASDDEADEIEEKHDKDLKKKAKKEKADIVKCKENFGKLIDLLKGATGNQYHELLDEAKKEFDESGNSTSEIVTIYRLDGEAYLKEGDYEKAEYELKKAFTYAHGKYCPELMNDFAILAEHYNESGKAKAFRFRAEILKPV